MNLAETFFSDKPRPSFSGGKLAHPKPPKKTKAKPKPIRKKSKTKNTRLDDPKALKKYSVENPDCELCNYFQSLIDDPNFNEDYFYKSSNTLTKFLYNQFLSKHPDFQISGGVHHIKYKSSGGPDVPENFLTTCMHHHNTYHHKGAQMRSFLFKNIKKINPNRIVCWDTEIGYHK